MKRTTTANHSRRPAKALGALGLTLFAANLLAAQLTATLGQSGTSGDPGTTPQPSNPDSDYTGTFYVTGVADADAYDLDKPLVGDAKLRWAYAFACMVDWYQNMYESIGTTLGSNEPRSTSAILSALKNLSGNVSGSFSKAIDLYIQTGGYMLSYISVAAWRPPSVTAYASYYYSSYPTELGTLEGFSQLLLENLYRAPAFVDLLEENSSTSGHAVVIWGAEFENGIVQAVYISDSDDNMYQYTRYPVVCTNGRIFLGGHWAPRVNALTFLYAPAGVPYTVPVNATPEAEWTLADLPPHGGAAATVRIPHSSPWMQAYMERYPTTYAAQLSQDSDDDGFTDAEEYVLGTDPADAGKKLVITALRFADGKPVVDFAPASNDGVAVFAVQGKANLADAWETHTDSDTDHRFFRVIATPVE